MNDDGWHLDFSWHGLGGNPGKGMFSGDKELTTIKTDGSELERELTGQDLCLAVVQACPRF